MVVYAICKNESAFVNRYVDSMKEADEIIVLDTGSSDDTVKKLKKRGVIVYQKKINRICQRDNITEELAKERLKIQNDNEFFVKKADFVIHNDGTLEKLETSLKEIIDKI